MVVAAAEADLAGVGYFLYQRAQQRRLAAAVHADQGGDLAAHERGGDPFEDLLAAERDAQAAERDQRIAHFSFSTSVSRFCCIFFSYQSASSSLGSAVSSRSISMISIARFLYLRPFPR